jgi:hypothetical protein
MRCTYLRSCPNNNAIALLDGEVQILGKRPSVWTMSAGFEREGVALCLQSRDSRVGEEFKTTMRRPLGHVARRLTAVRQFEELPSTLLEGLAKGFRSLADKVETVRYDGNGGAPGL